MDIISLYYFREAAKDLHFTNTARRLFISQQTLSAHIQRLENYYGVHLFNRRPSLTLTYAGEQLLKSAEKIVTESDNIKKKLTELNNHNVGQIRIGLSFFALRTCMPQILPKFYVRWPNVSVSLQTGDRHVLLQLLEEGAVDLAIASPGQNVGKNTCTYQISLFHDDLYLIVPNELLNKYYGEEAAVIQEREKAGTDLKCFSKLPFMLHKPGTRKREIADLLFEVAGYDPNVVREATTTDQISIRLPTHIGAMCCAESWIDILKMKEPDVSVFPIKLENWKFDRKLTVFTNKERYLSTYTRDLLRILERQFRAK